MNTPNTAGWGRKLYNSLAIKPSGTTATQIFSLIYSFGELLPKSRLTFQIEWILPAPGIML